MFKIIWMSEYNDYLLKNNIHYNFIEYIDYISNCTNSQFNYNYIKYLYYLDSLNNLDNNFCITTDEFKILNITKESQILNLINKCNLSRNRDYKIQYNYKKKYFLLRKKKYFYYNHMHLKCVL